MSKRASEPTPARSRAAMLLLKSGLALGVVWMVTLVALVARAVLIYLSPL